MKCHAFPAVEKRRQNQTKSDVVVPVVRIVPVAVGATEVPVVIKVGAAANHAVFLNLSLMSYFLPASQ